MDRIEGGKLRFKNRMARLNRLVELDAPVALLARELTIVMDALYLVNAAAVGNAIADVHESHVRRLAGYCVVDACVKPAINQGSDGNDMCEYHDKEARQYADSLDTAADEEDN